MPDARAYYDVVVVGAGSSGAVVAARLSEDPSRRVALVEAGPDYPDDGTLPDELKYGRATAAYVATHGHLWDYVARANAEQSPTPLPRGKVVGGTSAVNGQVFLRGLRRDFDAWAAAGNDGWAFADVLPAFRAIETDLDYADEWHGSDGPIRIRRYREEEWLPAQHAFVDACVAAGHPFCADANKPDAAGVGPIPFNNVDGLRASTLTTYIAAARGRPNLTILADTTALRFRVRGDRVVALEVDGQSLLEADEYVLSAGAIGSPLLLLRSGIGPAAALAAVGVDTVVELDGVGEHLADHQLADLVWEAGRAPDRQGPLPRVQVALRYTAERDDDMQITVRSAAPGFGDDTISLVPSLELPRSTGRITLTSSDAQAQPDIELAFLDEPSDLERLRDGVERALALAEGPALAPLLGRRLVPVDGELASLDAWLRKSVRTSHHLCGSCRMGPSAEDGAVVGPDCRVHGVSNLRVADASIFPTVVGANVNATALMIGERAARFVAEGG